MEDFSNLKNYDWFDCFMDGVVYVKYLTPEALDILDDKYNVAYSSYRTFDPSKYVQVVEIE